MLRIGTRGSRLAMWQANNLKALLDGKGISSELNIIKTKGDEIQHLSFDKIEGKGFFTREIEDALLRDEIDIAVHSLKDLPTNMHEDLAISGVSERANPCDILIIHPKAVDLRRPIQLKAGSTVGTSSIRRKVQLHHFDSEVSLVDIRGNVPTRINKVKEKVVDAIVLAAAGVDRLKIDLSEYKVVRFNPEEFIPAPAQGVVAYQCRRADKASRKTIQLIHHKEVSSCTNVERKILNLLDGGCQLPLGAYCTQDLNGHYHVHTVLGKDVGDPLARYAYSSSTSVGLADHIVTQLKNQTSS